MSPPRHFNPSPCFGLREERTPNVALYRGGELIAYHWIDPDSRTGRVLFGRVWPQENDIIVYANDFQPPPPSETAR